MMTEDLRDLLSANNVDEEDFDRLLYETLVVGVFQILVNRIQRDGHLLQVLRYYRNTTDDLTITTNIVQRYVGAKLPKKAAARINELMRAHLEKRDERAAITSATKLRLLKKQGFRCAICGSVISLENSHCDHVVAFKYVGDELRNNYQMLCSRCNLEKGASAYYAISRVLCD